MTRKVERSKEEQNSNFALTHVIQPIKALERKIIESDSTSAKLVLDFLKLDYDKDIKGLCSKILTCEDVNALYALRFVYNSCSVDEDVLNMIGDYLIREYNGQSKIMQKDLFLEKEYKVIHHNADLLNSFIRYLDDNTNLNLDKYQDTVIAKGTVEDAYQLAEMVDGVDKKKLAAFAIRSNDNVHILKFAELLDLSVVSMISEYLEKNDSADSGDGESVHPCL